MTTGFFIFPQYAKTQFNYRISKWGLESTLYSSSSGMAYIKQEENNSWGFS